MSFFLIFTYSPQSSFYMASVMQARFLYNLKAKLSDIPFIWKYYKLKHHYVKWRQKSLNVTRMQLCIGMRRIPFVLSRFSWTRLVSHKLSTKIEIPWLQSASELYRPSDRRLSAKLVPTFADRGCHVVSATDPYGSILGFLDRSRNFFIFEIVPQLYSRGWMDPVPEPLFFRNSGSAGNRNRISGSVSRNSDH
jgi:hypothetical protein